MTCSIYDYADSISDITERIDRYKRILNALEAGLEAFVPNSGIQQHKLDDSHVVIETKYGTISDYINGIRAVESTIAQLRKKLIGGMSYSRPHSSF